MCYAAYIGFVEGEKGLSVVDEEFREIVRQIYMIPGIGTHGVSCAGGFEPDDGYGRFWPRPFAHLGFAALPEIEHVREILNMIDVHAKADPDAYFYVTEGLGYVAPEKRKALSYSPDRDFRSFAIDQTDDGLYVAKLRLDLGSNGSLDSVPNHCCAPISLKGNQEAFDKSKARYEQIKAFWQSLEGKVKAFNTKHSFTVVDFEKKEFLPFR